MDISPIYIGKYKRLALTETLGLLSIIHGCKYRVGGDEMGALNLGEVKAASGTPLLNHHYLV
ncbi:hypothetical protein E1A91_D10G082400v1 [Gossypium mustelinum]|uniref:Uncharacterized protein n=1 Tax=Gossypium mustelinum TaxID=34275 RepID=A0A5D2T5C3_GOSMU|nr:hypothetical protein E1A91_D10G082400v1 [Gossypium mustelinum]